MLKEYGGYLPIELPYKKEYYTGAGVERLNCGRSAIYRALEDSGAKSVWLPYYNCQTVQDPAQKLGIKLKFYHIDENFLPINVSLEENEWILWVNYFGIAQTDSVQKIVEKYSRVIFDNTQAFFSNPLSGFYNIYSCRKFFGVTDGAYLIKDGLESQPLLEDRSSPRARFMIKCLEEGTNGAYQDFLENENVLALEVLSMSPFTRRVLMSIDYDEIRQKRRDNYRRLHTLLGKINILPVPEEADAIAYPLLVINPDIRKHLIENHIYVPQWWKYILDIPEATKWEKKISQYMLPLPIDQRYGVTDMEYISKMILDYLQRA